MLLVYTWKVKGFGAHPLFWEQFSVRAGTHFIRRPVKRHSWEGGLKAQTHLWLPPNPICAILLPAEFQPLGACRDLSTRPTLSGAAEFPSEPTNCPHPVAKCHSEAGWWAESPVCRRDWRLCPRLPQEMNRVRKHFEMRSKCQNFKWGLFSLS